MHFVFATVAVRGDGGKSQVALLAHSPTRARVGIVPCGPIFNAPLMAMATARSPAVMEWAARESLLFEASDSFFSYQPVLQVR